MKKIGIRVSEGSTLVYASLVGILTLTLLLRLYGIDWGLPTRFDPDYSYHPDEAISFRWSMWLSQGNTIGKEFIYGGTFYFVILRSCIYFAELFGDIIGGFNVLANAILVARYLHVFVALLTMLLVYECGRLLYNRATGLVAALALTVAPAHIVATQTVRPDAISAFLVILILYATAKLLKSEASGRLKVTIYSGLAVGAAAAFRLPLLGFALLPVFAYLHTQRPGSLKQFVTAVLSRNVACFNIAILLAYIVLSPHTLMYPEAFISDLKVTFAYETTAFPDALQRGPVFLQYAWRLLSQALGYPVYFLALGGMVFALLRRSVADYVVLLGIGLYFIMLSSVTWTVVRYTLPILPLLALLSGVAIVRLVGYTRRTYARKLVYCGAGFLLVWTLLMDLALLQVVAAKNIRDISSEWITNNISQDKKIVFIKNYEEDDFFNPTVPPNHTVSAFFLTKGLDSRNFFGKNVFDYLVLHEMFYADMERLGGNHPRNEVSQFHANMTNANLHLVKELKLPFQFMGIDFSGFFGAVDFLIVNPGIRIYQAQ